MRLAAGEGTEKVMKGREGGGKEREEGGGKGGRKGKG